MIIKELLIENFRNIKQAQLILDEHCLLVGPNNVGKSTILEALDLLLGPDRLNSADAINEHDFYKSQYLDTNGEIIPIKIECSLLGLNDVQKRKFHLHLEYWDNKSGKLAKTEDLKDDLDESRFSLSCLRVGFIGIYDKEEDEFSTKSYFLHPPAEEQSEDVVRKSDKREIGFLYLRYLRTGSRALSLERGSLLDVILKLKNISTSAWENLLIDLRKLGSTMEAEKNLRGVLNEIETKIKKYTPLVSKGVSTKFEVTNLTRKNLRQTLHLFAGSQPSEYLVPYRNLGSGSINVFLFALLSLIADIKKETGRNIIFAMEEPEVALPPYTQRKIIDDLFTMSDQCIVTSHSPYVGERFVGENILVIKNYQEGKMSGHPVKNEGIKEKIVRMDFRKKFAEGLLSKCIIAVEGLSDVQALQQVSYKLAVYNKDYMDVDLAGIIIIESDGGGGIDSVGKFFDQLGIKKTAFFDKGQKVDEKLFDVIKEHDYSGIEKLLVEEIPQNILEEFEEEAKNYSDYPKHLTSTSDNKNNVYGLLCSRKAEGYSAKLIEKCKKEADLPKTIVGFLMGLNDNTHK